MRVLGVDTQANGNKQALMVELHGDFWTAQEYKAQNTDKYTQKAMDNLIEVLDAWLANLEK